MAESYFSLGGDDDQIGSTIGDYYAFAPEYADFIVQNTAKGPDGIKQRARAFEEAGCDELIFFPDSADPEQVEQLAELIL
jgi:hypothetical protein